MRVGNAVHADPGCSRCLEPGDRRALHVSCLHLHSGDLSSLEIASTWLTHCQSWHCPAVPTRSARAAAGAAMHAGGRHLQVMPWFWLLCAHKVMPSWLEMQGWLLFSSGRHAGWQCNMLP